MGIAVTHPTIYNVSGTNVYIVFVCYSCIRSTIANSDALASLHLASVMGSSAKAVFLSLLAIAETPQPTLLILFIDLDSLLKLFYSVHQ
jgi:hypothetical protein